MAETTLREERSTRRPANTPTLSAVGDKSGLWVREGTFDSDPDVPPMGVERARECHIEGPWYGSQRWGGGPMKLIKRIAVAVGSLAALALAGGAHLRF